MALTDKEREILIDVLVYHYRKNSSDCGCGWAKLGYSHPEHQVEVFEESIAIHNQGENNE